MAGNGVELVWDGKRRDVEHVALPFQRVEIINESRATRLASPLMRSGPQLPPDPPFADDDGETPWRNKLIWGDNKYVLSSLIEGDSSIGLDSLAGKMDLVYIDPPFATGADFTFSIEIGEEVSVTKEPSAVEENAYRDTWGGGTSSYIQMLYERLVFIREMLSGSGSIYVHCDTRVDAYVRLILDELFGSDNCLNEIVWKRSEAHSDSGTYGKVHDVIFFYAKGPSHTWHKQHVPYTDDFVAKQYRYVEEGTSRRYRSADLSAAGLSGGGYVYEWHGRTRSWRCPIETMQRYEAEGRLDYTGKGLVRYKYYLDEMPGLLVQSVWADINKIHHLADERIQYPTQKPELLLERIIKASSDEGQLVGDFFCGSGTAMAVAEKLGRRWIGCDLGRFATHTTRKRLLGIENCKPFEILNLGRYERKYWQGIHAGEAVYEYFQFIVRLYHAEPVVGFTNLHGRKGEAMIHVGATDAPVTISEVRAAMDECKANGLKALDVLGWEWEMGLNNTGLSELQRQSGVVTRLFHIPHEIMDKRAVAAGDVHFYEAAYIAATPTVETGRAVRIELTDFLVAIDDYVREKVGDKVKKWSDWIDYWAVDFEHDGDVFHNQWQAYRTRKEPKLELTSGPHTYASAGKRQILVKVVDIFGNDTTALLEVEV